MKSFGEKTSMNSPTLKEIDRELKRMAGSGAPDPEAAITSYLAGELPERKPEERLQLLDELSRHSRGSAGLREFEKNCRLNFQGR